MRAGTNGYSDIRTETETQETGTGMVSDMAQAARERDTRQEYHGRRWAWELGLGFDVTEAGLVGVCIGLNLVHT